VFHAAPPDPTTTAPAGTVANPMANIATAAAAAIPRDMIRAVFLVYITFENRAEGILRAIEQLNSTIDLPFIDTLPIRTPTNLAYDFDFHGSSLLKITILSALKAIVGRLEL
jgi:hypothetical protein